MSSSDSARDMYQFRIWLRAISPAIWRRFLVRSDSTIADLHYMIQLIMGWTDVHLHTFFIHGREYGVHHSGGPWGFLALQDRFRLGYTIHRTVEMLQELMWHHGKLEEEERDELSQLLYWLNAHRFPRRLVNQRLRWYATKDPRWRDAL